MIKGLSRVFVNARESSKSSFYEAAAQEVLLDREMETFLELSGENLAYRITEGIIDAVAVTYRDESPEPVVAIRHSINRETSLLQVCNDLEAAFTKAGLDIASEPEIMDKVFEEVQRITLSSELRGLSNNRRDKRYARTIESAIQNIPPRRPQVQE